MTVRGGGVPCHAMAFVPPLRMGVHHLGACRRCACMHRGSGHGDPPDTRLRRESIVPQQRAPLGRVIPTTTSVSTCSGLSRLGLETIERRPEQSDGRP